MTSTDILIIISTHLFVLSMVNEKFTNFLKLNLQSIYESRKDFWFLKIFLWSKRLRNKFKDFLRNNLKNLRLPEGDKEKEKLRERGITNLTIICGIITATFAGADLFHLIKNAKSEHVSLLLNWSTFFNKLKWELDWGIQWENLKLIFYAILNHGFGIIFSGLFLSLGSKFWHDLLDLLFFYKNARTKISDSNTFSFDRIEAFEEYVQLPYSQIYNQVTSQYSDYFKNDSNVLYTLSGKKDWSKNGLPTLIVYVKDKSKSNIPSFLKIELPNSKAPVTVNILVVQDSIPVANVAISNGDSVEKRNAKMGGTICCALRSPEDGKIYLLTCSHVLNNGTSIGFGNFLPVDQQEVVESIRKGDVSSSVIGKYCYSLRNFLYDIALVEPNGGNSFHFNDDIITTPIELEEKDKLRKNVRMRGFVSSGIRDGVIVDFATGPIPIRYEVDDIQFLENLVVISRDVPSGFNYQNARPTSRPGDSGALIYDANSKRPIAMVIAASDNYTFAIPIISILEELEMTIFTNN